MTRMAIPFTQIPDRPRIDVETYVVQPGDTVFGIAQKYGIRPETIMWANKNLELNPDLLRVSDKLVILPVNGVYHEIKQGDTLTKIASKYKVQPVAIVSYEWNQLQDENQALTSGSYLIVPGGQKPFVPRTVSRYNGPIPSRRSPRHRRFCLACQWYGYTGTLGWTPGHRYRLVGWQPGFGIRLGLCRLRWLGSHGIRQPDRGRSW